VLAYALGLLAGCGGGGGGAPEEGGGAAATTGDEEPIFCSVPNAPAMEDFVAGARLVRAGDPSGIVTLERACEADNACACSIAGGVLAGGEVGAADVERGLALLERGCQGADPWGCYWLGAALFEHRPSDAARASEAFATACEDEQPNACQALGRLRMSGIGGEEDAREAVRLYESACEDGVVFACHFLGQAAAAGLGMDAPDPARARELLAWSCEQAQLAYSCTALAELDAERRDDLLRTACEAGDPEACVGLEVEAPPSDGAAAQALAIPAADAEARELLANDDSLSGATVGGDVDLSSLGLPRTCVGFVGREPSHLLRLPPDVDVLELEARADADSVIAVRDAAGRWRCNDDAPGGLYHARVRIAQPPAGLVAVWAGALRPGTLEGTIALHSEGVEVADAAFATPAGPQSVTIPASARTRFYELRVISVPGVRGTVRLDGRDLWAFGPNGGTVESDEAVQCALGAGEHTLELVVGERARTAHGEHGGPLVEMELHGFAAAGGEPTAASRLVRVQWSPPEAPQTRATTFRLSRAQAADRGRCAAASGG
jgi:TPR repeat protein